MGGQRVAEMASFIEANAVWTRTPLVPEIGLYLATEVAPMWEATEAWLEAHQLPPPFWAFAWPGGQILARYVLDHPEEFRGRRVLDFASGCGIAAIAAALVGAEVVANEIDAFAGAAIALNAERNGATVGLELRDLLGEGDLGYDVVLTGDICYRADLAEALVAWIGRQRGRVLLSDGGRGFAPTSGFMEIGRIEVPVPRDLEGADRRTARLLEYVQNK